MNLFLSTKQKEQHFFELCFIFKFYLAFLSYPKISLLWLNMENMSPFGTTPGPI